MSPVPDRRSVASPATCWGSTRVAALICRPSPVQPRAKGPTPARHQVVGSGRWDVAQVRDSRLTPPAPSPRSIPPLNPVVWRAQDRGSTAIWNLSDRAAGAPEDLGAGGVRPSACWEPPRRHQSPHGGRCQSRPSPTAAPRRRPWRASDGPAARQTGLRPCLPRHLHP